MPRAQTLARGLRSNSSLYAPATLAIAGVPMNGALLPVEEFKPRSWVGRPVTIGHPMSGGEHRAAADHDAVGTIANAWVQGDRLMATLKLDDDRLPARIKRLIENEAPLDVSTGFFSRDQDHGEGYVTCLDVIPDHLALLPDDAGACSWQDGCGLRAQVRGNKRLRVNNCCKECETMADLEKMIAAAIRKHVGPAQESEQEVIERIVAESIRATAERDRGEGADEIEEMVPPSLIVEHVNTRGGGHTGQLSAHVLLELEQERQARARDAANRYGPAARLGTATAEDMRAPSSLQVYRANRGEPIGRDPCHEAVLRDIRYQAASIHRLRTQVTSEDDEAVAAMRPRTTTEIVKVWHDMGGK